MFRQYYNPLCNFAASIINDDLLAQDIVQDVFTNIWDKRDEISISGEPKHFLFTAVKNKSIEVYRKRKNEKKLSESVKIIQDENIVQQADKYMLREHINNSLRQLPPKCRYVFELSKMNGLTYVEIAKEMEISVKTVENHIGKAYRLLRQLLSDKVNKKY